MLNNHPCLDTRQVDEFQAVVRRLLADDVLNVSSGGRGFRGQINYCALQQVGLFHGAYQTPLSIELRQVGAFGVGFPLKGSGSHRLGSVDVAVSEQQGSVVSPGEAMRLGYGADFAHLALLIRPAALVSKLTALIGAPPKAALGFAPSVDFRRPEAAALRRLVLFVAHELSASETPLSSLVAAELEQALLVSFLLGSTSNYGDLLAARAPGSAPWQVRRAEEYIEAHWDQPITIEALALVTDASARSLFYSFRKSRGYSPMAFVKRTRLRHARQMLESPGSDTVTGIAFDCGFANPSHFASDYLRSFGEHPSDTLRRARGGPGRTNRDVG